MDCSKGYWLVKPPRDHRRIILVANQNVPDRPKLSEPQKICDYLQIAVNTLPDEEFNFSIKDFCSKYKLDIKKTYKSIRK